MLDDFIGILTGVGGLLVAAFTLFFAGKKRGKNNEQNKRLRDQKERVDAGRRAVRDGRSSNPVERLRNNESKW